MPNCEQFEGQPKNLDEKVKKYEEAEQHVRDSLPGAAEQFINFIRSLNKAEADAILGQAYKDDTANHQLPLLSVVSEDLATKNPSLLKVIYTEQAKREREIDRQLNFGGAKIPELSEYVEQFLKCHNPAELIPVKSFKFKSEPSIRIPGSKD
jgi:hypothetical protein